MMSIVACSYLRPLLTRQAHVACYYSQKPYALRRMTEALPENLLGSWIKSIMAGTAHGELERSVP